MPGSVLDLVVRPFLTPSSVFSVVERELAVAGSVLIDFPCAFLANSFLRSTAIEVALEIDVFPFGPAALLLFELS